MVNNITLKNETSYKALKMPNKEDKGEKNNGLIKCESLPLEDELREDEEYEK